MITNFPSKNLSNPGGFRTFEFIPAYQVIGHPPLLGTMITSPFTIKDGAAWLKGYSTAETLNFNESSDDSPNGPSYDLVITGFYPGDKLELLQLMNEMDGQPFLVRLTDAQGQLRVAGSHGYPLIFLSAFSSGTTRSDRKGFEFSFKGKSIFKAPVYNV